jgi:transposase-like protein
MPFRLRESFCDHWARRAIALLAVGSALGNGAAQNRHEAGGRGTSDVNHERAFWVSGDGEANYEIARRLDVASNSVGTWRRRFEENGTAWVGKIAPGRGQRSWSSYATEDEVVRTTTEELPGDSSTQWSTPHLADRFGIGKDTVARIWRDHNLRPCQS